MAEMTKDRSKSKIDLFNISASNLPKADPAQGAIPPIVEAALSDFDSTYAKAIATAGVCDHPQIVAAMVATCNRDYICQLLEASPAVGTALVYGGILLRNTEAFIDMLDLVSDQLVLPSNLDTSHLKLLISASNSALTSRAALDLDPGSFSESVDRFRAVSENWLQDQGAAGKDEDCSAFQDFSRYRELLDEIKRALSANTGTQDGFYSDLEPTTNNYLKAMYGLLCNVGSEVQREAQNFLQRLDAPLLNALKFGLEKGTYTNTKGPRKITL